MITCNICSEWSFYTILSEKITIKARNHCNHKNEGVTIFTIVQWNKIYCDLFVQICLVAFVKINMIKLLLVLNTNFNNIWVISRRSVFIADGNLGTQRKPLPCHWEIVSHIRFVELIKWITIVHPRVLSAK